MQASRHVPDVLHTTARLVQPPTEARSSVERFAAGDAARPGWYQYAIELGSARGLIGDIGVCTHDNRMQGQLPERGTPSRAHVDQRWVADDLLFLRSDQWLAIDEIGEATT